MHLTQKPTSNRSNLSFNITSLKQKEKIEEQLETAASGIQETASAVEEKAIHTVQSSEKEGG